MPPSLRFAVDAAEPAAFAAAPTLLLRLRITNAGDEPIRSLSLNAQARIQTAGRRYSPAEQTRLRDLFGQPEQWATTLRSMLWTQTSVVVPPFEVAGVAIAPGSRVRLRPHPGGDVFDIALTGRVAVVEAIEQDYEERIHVAVTLEDDPGRDLGLARQPGHRFFFAPDELEPLTG